MARQEAARTGIFSTRSELEAELDRLGSAGEFDSVIARKTGLSPASVAEYLRSRPLKPRRPRAKVVDEPGPAPAEAAMSLPLAADDRRILNSEGALLAYASSASVAAALTTAINSAGALADAMIASPAANPKVPSAVALPKRRAGRPRKTTAETPPAPVKAQAGNPTAPASPQPTKRPVGRPRKHPAPETAGPVLPERKPTAPAKARATPVADEPLRGRPGRKPYAAAGKPMTALAAKSQPANEKKGGRLAPRPSVPPAVPRG